MRRCLLYRQLPDLSRLQRGEPILSEGLFGKSVGKGAFGGLDRFIGQLKSAPVMAQTIARIA